MTIRKTILLLITLLLLGGILMPLQSKSKVEELREMLPRMHGAARLKVLDQLQQLSVDSNDNAYRVRCISDLLDESYKQGENELYASCAISRTVFFYNSDMQDSLFRYVPIDIDRLRHLKMYDRMYEVWSYKVNMLAFSQKCNMALREVQTMMNDARLNDNKYGEATAYYIMGNVYANMHNLDESAAAYRKGLDLFKQVTPTPPTIPDVYSYYGDLLNDKKDYEKLEKLTVEWKDFLDRYIVDYKIRERDAAILRSYYYLACAQAALGLGHIEQASEALSETQKYIPSEGDYVGQSWLFYSAQLDLQRGDYRHALELNSRRMFYDDGDEMATQIQVLSQRAEIMSKIGRFEEAANCLRTIVAAKDSISSAETRNQLNEMNTLFRVDELEREQERAQFRNTMIIAAIIFVGLVIFTFFRIRSARRLKKAHNELLVAYDQLEETTTAKERIESDLRIARNIQMGMVPSTFPDRPDLDLFASMTPAKEVGGDLYGYYLDGDQLYIALGDVSGKGVPASLFMAQATRLFRTLAAQHMMPAEIATSINNALSGEDNETSMFVTMYLGLIDLKTGHLHFCNAGHNPPVLLRDGKAEFIEMIPNAPIGLWPELEYEGEEIEDISNCPLFVYTDGLNEAENRQQDQFTDERLLEILETTPFESCRQTVELLKEAVEQHRDGADPNDDLTMLCVKVNKETTNN